MGKFACQDRFPDLRVTVEPIGCRLLLADEHAAESLPWDCEIWSLQKGDNMKLRHLAAIAVLLTLGCQSGDTSSTPLEEDVNSTDTPAATSSVDPVTEDTLMKVSLNVTGMK